MYRELFDENGLTTASTQTGKSAALLYQQVMRGLSVVIGSAFLSENMLNRDRITEKWKAESRHLKVEAYALYLAYRDPRVLFYVNYSVHEN